MKLLSKSILLFSVLVTSVQAKSNLDAQYEKYADQIMNSFAHEMEEKI